MQYPLNWAKKHKKWSERHNISHKCSLICGHAFGSLQNHKLKHQHRSQGTISIYAKHIKYYSQLPITRTFQGNRKKFELSGVWVISSLKQITGNKDMECERNASIVHTPKQQSLSGKKVETRNTQLFEIIQCLHCSTLSEVWGLMPSFQKITQVACLFTEHPEQLP